MLSPPPLPKPVRSRAVTVLACLVIVCSAFASLLSGLIVLMLIAPHNGSTPIEVGGLFLLFGPPTCLLAGVGLLLQKRWAYYYFLLVLAGVLVFNAYGFVRGPVAASTRVSADGVTTTTIASGASYSIPVVVVCVAMAVVLLSGNVRDEFRAEPERIFAVMEQRNWQVGHVGRDMMYYEEWVDGAWQRIDLDGEMLMGRAHHVIYFASPESWQLLPEWARHRRKEIIARVKQKFPAPDYEYQGDGQ